MFSFLNPYKYLIIAAGIAIALGVAYYSGYRHEHDKLVTYKAQVIQQAKDQESIVKQKDTENEQKTQAVANDYKQYYDRLIAGLRHQLSSSKVPSTLDSHKGNDGAPSELSGTCEGTEFYANALKDALRLQLWIEWAKAHDLKVEN